MLIAIYSLFIIPMITSFFSVLGMAIERFQAFAVYRDTRVLTKRFSIAWFLSSWTLAICFVVILKFQLKVCCCCICPVSIKRCKCISCPDQTRYYFFTVLDWADVV